jgi:serine/tyrosine/threonine adenylyltransferase
LPLVNDDIDKAAAILTERLETFSDRFETAYGKRTRFKLGLRNEIEGDLELAQGLLERMAQSKVDYTNCFRRLVDVAAGADDGRFVELFDEPAPIREWLQTWRVRFDQESVSRDERVALMRQANPAFIPRNHRIEEMIAAATKGDMQPFERLCRVLARPYDDQPDEIELTLPPGDEQWNYRTFCGT